MLTVISYLPLKGNSMPIVEFEGQQYDFPEDATQEEMTATLSSLPKVEEEVVAEDAPEPFREESVIKKDEGTIRNKDGAHVSYKDRKVISGGRGHMLTKEEKKLYPVGTAIPDDVVDAWFKTDMEEADKDLTSVLERKKVHVPDEVFDILQNMTFNLGKKGISEFKDMWTAIEVGDWKAAAAEMRDSDWAKQVGNRAVRLSNRMASIESKVEAEESKDTLTPSKGGLFKDDKTGELFIIDAEGNKTGV